MKKLVLTIGCALILIAGMAQPALPFNAFSYTTLLVIDSKDNVYISGKNNKIIRITPDGKAADFAGNPNGRAGTQDGNMTTGRFSSTNDMAIDANDNIYVADYNRVRKVSPDGMITTIAGTGRYEIIDGPGKSAGFTRTEHIAVDKSGNIYVVDQRTVKENNKSSRMHIIRKIDAGGNVSTLQSGGKELRFDDVRGMVCDKEGNLYICLVVSRCIKKIAPDGTVSTVAGQCGKRKFHPVYKQGDVSSAELMTPSYATFDKNGDLYFTDTRLHRIIKIANKKVSTVAGNSKVHDHNIAGGSYEGYRNGKALQALFDAPCSIAFDRAGNLFIADMGNNCVRKLTPDGTVSTFFARDPNKKAYDSEVDF
jgi:sugar lactone lactonase YvrE